MKAFIPVLCLASLALAEPPVGDGYPAARPSHDHHHNDFQDDNHVPENQRSLLQEYGPSSNFASSRSLSTEYGIPNSRTASNSGRHSQRYAPPAARVSFNQRFRSLASKSSSQGQSSSAKSLSQDHGVSNARSGISQEYGYPNSRSLSQEYGVPSVVSARALSSEYGVPNSRSNPSEEYGAPVIATRSNQKPESSSFRSALPAKALSHDYSARSQFSTSSLPESYTALAAGSNDVSQGYDSSTHTPKQFAKSSFGSRSLSQTYGTPKNVPSSSYNALSSQSLSTSYGVPSARSLDIQGYDTASQSYDVPNQRGVSDTYGVPSSRGLSQEYGAPSNQPNLKTSAITSSYSPASARSPSSTYLPSSRDVLPSEQYGVPNDNSQSVRIDGSQDYDYARARALDELLNQEPASYEFAYQIEDGESGSEFGHTESREENRAEGSYFVVLPDGTKQTVEYEADEGGFKPRISVEAGDATARAGGYDDNAAEIRSGGPY